MNSWRAKLKFRQVVIRLQSDTSTVARGWPHCYACYMGVTASAMERAQYLAAIDRLAKSRVLHGSESLCRLLRYLAEHSLQNPGVPIKEYQTRHRSLRSLSRL